MMNQTLINYIVCDCLCCAEFSECQKKQTSEKCLFVQNQIKQQLKIFHEESLPELRLSQVLEL